MAMTQLALVFLGSLATLATAGSLLNVDQATRVVMMFGASILWAWFGMSSFDVIVRDTGFASASEPILPLAYLGIGLAIVVGIGAIWSLLQLMRSETESMSPGDIAP